MATLADTVHLASWKLLADLAALLKLMRLSRFGTQAPAQRLPLQPEQPASLPAALTQITVTTAQ
jgi:hypothetical protein